MAFFSLLPLTSDRHSLSQAIDPEAIGQPVVPPATADAIDLQAGSVATEPDPSVMLTELDQELNRLQRQIRIAIQIKLAELSGKSFGSLEANKSFVTRIHEMLDGHGLRVKCPECGTPAILRVSPRKGAAAGSFVFDHKVNGKRTFHGGAGVMPKVSLVAKLPREKKSADAKDCSRKSND